MFDPKEIYGKLNIREIIGDVPLTYALDYKDWPANELAFIRLSTKSGHNGWVLIAPGSTPESVTAGVRAVAKRLTERKDDTNGL